MGCYTHKHIISRFPLIGQTQFLLKEISTALLDKCVILDIKLRKIMNAAKIVV